MKIFLVFALVPLILTIGITPALLFDLIPKADAVKSKGTTAWKYGSATAGTVCGDRLCSEIESDDGPFLERGRMALEHTICKEGLELIIKYNGSPACVKPDTKIKLIQRGWAISDQVAKTIMPLEVKVKGDQQVRRGTTHFIEVQVVRGDIAIEGAKVFIDIEDYGEDIIKEFDGYTNSEGYFVFSWEIPQKFDDVETLLVFIDVTDGISSKTELFKFQVYCLPGEKNCLVEGN